MVLELSSVSPISQLSSTGYGETPYAAECSSPFSIGCHGIGCKPLSKETAPVSGFVGKVLADETLAYHILTRIIQKFKKYLHILIWSENNCFGCCICFRRYFLTFVFLAFSRIQVCCC